MGKKAGGSSRDERKQKGATRALKKARRAGNKKPRRNGSDEPESDEGSDAGDYKEHMFIATPAQQNAIEQGATTESLKKRKKKRGPQEVSNMQVSIKRLKAPDFTDLKSFNKVFWTAGEERGPFGYDLKMQRKSIAVLVKGEEEITLKCPAPIMTLTDPALHSTLTQLIQHLHLTKLTAVQMQCWPAVLSGLNVLAIAPTGSGKTYGYGLTMAPHILDRIKNSSSSSSSSTSGRNPVALVLVPTRELAVQVASALKPLRKLFNIRAVPVYGGQDREQQLSVLFQGGTPHIVVATPGRLLDLVATKTLSLKEVTYLVLDEADRMLNMGFFEQLHAISKQVRPDRQSLLFSATFPGKLREAASDWVENGLVIKCGTFELTDMNATGISVDLDNEDKPKPKSNDKRKEEHNDGDGREEEGEEEGGGEGEGSATAAVVSQKATASSGQQDTSLTISHSVKQYVHLCASHKKPRLLIKYLERIRNEEKETKRQNLKGIEMIHGQLPQSSRERALSNFKAGKCNVLCATDVAARGIHIKKLQHVINYDFPTNLDQYCHRVGRTGRQGAEGSSYSLITRNMAPIAGDLIDLLRSCGQTVEPNLDELAADFLAGNLGIEGDDDEEGEGEEDDNVDNET